MKINRQGLLDAIKDIQPGIASKEILEQSQSIVFDKDRLRSCNDEVSVQCPFKTGIAGAVPAAELAKYLAKIKDEEVEVKVDGNQLLITSKKGEAGISLEAEIVLPLEDLEIDDDKWDKLPEDFCAGVKFSLFCTSRDMSKLVLTCLSIRGEHITACDNLRVIRYTMDRKIKKAFLLPSAAASVLIQYSPVKYTIGNGWVHFLNDRGIKFSCRTVNVEYPDVEGVLEVKGLPVQLPRNLDEILEEVEVFSKSEFEQDDSVDVSVADNNLTVKAESGVGWAKHSKRIKYSGKPIEFQVHPSFLLQASSLMDTMIVGKEKLRIDGDNFVHIACLRG